MPLAENDPDALGSAFPQTRWSMVRHAQEHDPAALAELCQAYWYPLYAFVRRKGLGPEDAEDVTQGFFHSVIERESLLAAAPEHGRLRAFLLAAIQHHVADLHRRKLALKRGGKQVVHMDPQLAEQLLSEEPAGDAPPEAVFDRHWAQALVDAVLKEMADYYARLGRSEIFAVLRVYLEWNGAAPPYAEAAARLESNEGAVRTAVHAMRQRFRQIIQRHIGETVSTAAEAQEEMEYLCRVLAAS